MAISPWLKTTSLFGAALAVPVLFCNCKTTAGSYKDVEYDPAKLKTPGGHGLEKKDYPFDDNGAYRKDWVRNNTRGKTRSASPGYDSSATLASTDAPMPSGPTEYPSYAEASAEREAAGSVGGQTAISVPTSPPPTPSPVATPAPTAQYHKVVKGDTLFSLSKRYGTSVAELKRINGLTGDGIFVDQVLRLP